MKRYIKSTSEKGRKDAELLATDGSWELWTPHTFEASIYLARKGADRDHWAKWDTAYEENGSRYFDQFIKKGPLYVFINRADPTDKYQYHAETNSFYDWDDRPADFKSFICEHPAFAEFFGIDCNDVEACDKVTANSDTGTDLPTFREFATTEWEVLNDGSKRLKLKDLFIYFGTDKQWNASDPGYWYEIKVGDKTYKESKKYSINNKERCYKAMQRAVSELLQSDSIESCDEVTASTKPYPSIPAGWERVPEGDDDEGNWSTISKELPNNGGYIWLDLLYDDNDRRYYELQIGYRNSDGTIGDIHPLISKEFYRLGDAVKYAEDRINHEIDSEEDIESCDRVDACGDQKYFANMVNCSADPELDDDFLIEGYYDNQRRGLAESAETSDISALNDLANEYANKGYYIVVHNLTDGVITEFSADNWFNDIAPDGGAELFMSW